MNNQSWEETLVKKSREGDDLAISQLVKLRREEKEEAEEEMAKQKEKEAFEKAEEKRKSEDDERSFCGKVIDYYFANVSGNEFSLERMSAMAEALDDMKEYFKHNGRKMKEGDDDGTR